MRVDIDDRRLRGPHGGPRRPLLGRALTKGLVLIVAIVAIASGVRFAWDQLLRTGLGGIIGGVRGAAGDVFTSEDILRSGRAITGALIRERFLPADGRGYTQRVTYTDRDSLARWTQSATYDAVVDTSVDTRNLPEDAVQSRWEDGSSIVYEIHLPQPEIEPRFWVSEARDVDVHCNFAEATWRFVTVNPTACVDDGVRADPHLRWRAEKDFLALASADAALRQAGRQDVEQMVEDIATPFIEPLARKYGFAFRFEFVWDSPTTA